MDIPIGELAAPLIVRFPKMGHLRRGNIYARLRMLALYGQSAAWGGLVLGTSNKTEMLLGYSTIYGDSAAALQPFADLYKRHVRSWRLRLNYRRPFWQKRLVRIYRPGRQMRTSWASATMWPMHCSNSSSTSAIRWRKRWPAVSRANSSRAFGNG